MTFIMSDLINSVTALCKLLERATGITLKTDLFRLSMLNKVDANEIQLMVSVLHNLCCVPHKSACKGSASFCVSSYMIEEGGNIAFLMSPDAPSRQLLLCLAWVISHGALENVIYKIILQSPLGKEVLMQVEDGVELQNPMKPPCEKPEDFINYAVFLTGKIHHDLKAVRSFREDRIKMYAKVLSETGGFQGLPHLAVADLQLSKSPAESTEFLARCQPCLHVIEAYLKWQRRSHFFWQWMDSILKGEEQLLAEKIQKKENSHKAMSTSEVDHLNRFLKKLEENMQQKVKGEPQIPKSLDSFLERDVRGNFLSSNGVDDELEKLDSKIKNLTEVNERKIKELSFKLTHHNIREKDKILWIVNSIVKGNVRSRTDQKEMHLF